MWFPTIDFPTLNTCSQHFGAKCKLPTRNSEEPRWITFINAPETPEALIINVIADMILQ